MHPTDKLTEISDTLWRAQKQSLDALEQLRDIDPVSPRWVDISKTEIEKAFAIARTALVIAFNQGAKYE